MAFVTGGSSGIGLGIARAFADAGMKVVIGYRTEKHLDEALEQFKDAKDRLHAIRVDVVDRPGMEQAAQETTERFGKIHVIVNNAGIQNPAPLGAMGYEDWDQMMRVNLDGVFNGVHVFLPHIKAHGEGGQIITTSSILGLFTIGGAFGAYCAAKFAVVAMMEVLRAELASDNIGVSALCPGPVKSNLDADTRNSATALEPLEVGQIMLQGMRRNDLYILTHPEFGPVVEARSEAFAASIPNAERLPEARTEAARSMLQNSIYPVERDRRRCAQKSAGR